MPWLSELLEQPAEIIELGEAAYQSNFINM